MISMSKSLKAGYSYIELMVAVLIIVILLGFVGPRMFSLLSDTKKASTKNSLKVIMGAIKEYQAHTGSFPPDLKALVVKPEGVTGWERPYVGDEDSANPEVPKDGWGQEFEYKVMPRGSKPPVELYSLGDPAKEDTEENRIYAK